MTTKAAAKKETTAQDAIAQVPPEPSPARAATSPKGGPRVAGKLAKPVYLIHRGKFEVTVPAVTRESVQHDPEADNFGEVINEVVEPEFTVKGELPKGTRFGQRKVRLAHEVWDKAEEQQLRARGFEDATEAEINASEKVHDKSRQVDQIAASERVRAQQNLKRMTTGGITRRDRDEE